MSGRASSTERGSSPGGPGESLRTRRRKNRRRALVAFCIIFLLLCTGIVYELRQSAVRIAHIEVFNADQSFATIASHAMQGNYLGIIPRDSTFFFPAARIRADILAAYPDIAAVSLFRSGLTGLSIKIDTRVPIARWCGLAPSGAGIDEYCYIFDASGLIFDISATTTKTINSFTLYAPLEGATLEPLRATILHPEKLPAVFDFARQLDTFGSRVTHIVFRDDEVDDYLASGTRVTYVLGNEQNAFTALVSARTNFNLANGSIEYVDLRFDGKMYLKKK
jgi:hypothetical protein